jgi:hypothetical protein
VSAAGQEGDLAFTGGSPGEAIAATGLLAGAAALAAWRRRGATADDGDPAEQQP